MKCKLGNPVFKEDESLHFYVEREGVIVVAGQTGYGKSILIKPLAINEAYDKKFLLFFDYGGEHRDLIYPNCMSDSPDCIDKLNIISKIGFMISDFTKAKYWSSLGFPTSASQALAKLAKQKDRHQDDPEVFYEIIRNLPTFSESSEGVHFASKGSMIQKFRKEVFIRPDEENRVYIKDWGRYLLDNPQTLINLNLNQVDGRDVARCVVGVILDQLIPYIIKKKITPISIFIEEADLLCPNNETNIPYSLEMISEYSLKLQKYGIRMYLVTQILDNLHASVRNNVKMFFLGRLFKGDILADMTNSLLWRRIDNYREFIMYNNAEIKFKFIPHESPTLFLKRF